MVVTVGFASSFFAEDAQETFSFWLLGLFLHTFLHDNRYLIGYLLVDSLLFVQVSGLSGTSAVPYPLKDWRTLSMRSAG